MNLADHLFLVCHDEHTGRPRVHEDMLGVALGTALLAELLFPPERLVVGDDGTVSHVAHVGPPPADPLQHRVWGLVRRECRPRDVGAWIRVLAYEARDQVGGRLADLAVVDRVVERRAFRSSVTAYPAMSADWVAYAATARLHNALHVRPMNTWDAQVAALVHTVSLDRHLTFGCEQAHPSLADLTEVLPPSLGELLRCAWSEIAVITMSPR